MIYEGYDYTLTKVEWNDDEHKSARITAKRKHLQTGKEEDAWYVAHQDDTAPMNIFYWNFVQRHKDMIRDNPYMRIMTGQDPVPEGYVIRNKQLINIAEEKRRVRDTINREIGLLYTGRAFAEAERNPVYAANRKKRVDRLLSLENHPDFPFINVEEDREEGK